MNSLGAFLQESVEMWLLIVLTYVKRFVNAAELLQCGLQVLRDFLGDDLWRGKVCGVFQALVFEPEDVEADLIALHQLVVGEDLEAFRLLTLVAVPRVEAGYEVFKVFVAQRVSLEREVLVGA